MASNINFSKPIYCVVTGASRGIGRTLAVETARRSLDKLILVLLARSESGLNETKKLVEAVKNDANVFTFAIDLSKPDVEEFKKIINDTLVHFEQGNGSVLIFHNAGQTGHLKAVKDLPDVSIWQDYFTLNVFSVTALNAVLINAVQKFTKKITVVNITSLYGRKAGKFVGMYGSGKAARDMYFKVLAEEEPYITVLNWSPGMVRTDMVTEFLTQLDSIRGTNEKDEIIKGVLTSEQTVNKMFAVLEKNAFKSGDIIDYYD